MSSPSSDTHHANAGNTNDTTPKDATATNDDRDDLTRRLSALRASASTPTPPPAPQDDKALEARFRRLFLRKPPQPDFSASTPKHAAVSDEQVSSFVASVQNELEQQPTGTRQVDEGEIEALLAEASQISAPRWEHSPDEDGGWGDGDGDWDWDSGGGGGGEGGGVPEWLRETPHEQVQRQEEDEILRIVRDEVEFERRHASALPSPCGSDGGREDSDDKGPREEQDDIAVLERRLCALGGAAVGAVGGGLQLPSAPSTVPGVLAKKGDGAGVSETHVIGICNEDAEYTCSGCDGDIYCSECLHEAHTGPDAGYEERRHKWTKYIRPNKVLSAA